MLACTIFRNFVLNKQKIPKYVNFWAEMNVDLKAQMKEAFLSALGSDEKLVRNAVANVIASIAAVEIPRNEWPQLI